ncbi:endonuclease/exonuclease/phosphatase family protein [Tateyamaria omphalii]|uniref:endonuclease/exonuclease/phosphatase family protein n=1 Tax=Tateyamaria omphalii TaxID=299262 RepID=UPI001C99E7E4|nr:endonuclease/exonuclease/phosphatase family protein [Tateyamaria omphalii]MBY5931633.1 endonuclease/exonuclease/phosphatase family protein [Tateyamaria omphalii]
MGARDISFASFNLLNLQTPGDAIYGDTDGWDPIIYQRKVDYTASVMGRLDADVVGLQELWAADALDQVLEEAGMMEEFDPLVPPDHTGNRIVCAAAVRKGMLVGDPEWIVDFPEEYELKTGGDDPQQDFLEVSLSTFSRPILHFQVQPDDRTPVIHVFVCHFKSRRPTQIWRERSWYEKEVHGSHATALGYAISTVRRTAEAAALRVIITKLIKKTDTPVVVIGDMNDGKDSNTLNILSEQPTYLSPLSTGGGDNALYTAQTIQEYRSVRDVYYTHVYKGQRESLDHIMFSQEFYDNSKRRKWAFDEMVVQNDHLNFDDHKESGTNDHGVIRVGFKWKPAPDATS